MVNNPQRAADRREGEHRPEHHAAQLHPRERAEPQAHHAGPVRHGDQDAREAEDHRAAERLPGRRRRRLLLRLRRQHGAEQRGVRQGLRHPLREPAERRLEDLHDAEPGPREEGPVGDEHLHPEALERVQRRSARDLGRGRHRPHRDDGAEQELQQQRGPRQQRRSTTTRTTPTAARSGFQPGSTFKLFTLLALAEDRPHAEPRWSTAPRAPSRLRLHRTAGSPTPRTARGRSATTRARPRTGSHSVTAGHRALDQRRLRDHGQQLDLCDIRKIGASPSACTPPTAASSRRTRPRSSARNYVAPLSMATAYAGIANNGTTCTPVAIDKVVKADGSDARRAEDVLQASRSTRRSRSPRLRAARRHDRAAPRPATRPPDGLYEFGKTGTTDERLRHVDDRHDLEGHDRRLGGQHHRLPGPPCRRTSATAPRGYSSQAAVQRHCLWKGIQTAVNKVYGGATSWPQPESQYLYGGHDHHHAVDR